MKTFKLLNRCSRGIFVSSALAAAAIVSVFSGCATGRTASATMEMSKACDGCKESPLWVINDRGPAGKGSLGSHVVGTVHTCAYCTGSITVENGKVTNTMRAQEPCASLLCCK